MSPPPVALELGNRLDELARLGPFVQRFGWEHRLSGELQAAIQLALEEIVTNVICYGFEDNGPHIIRIQLAHAGTNVAAAVEDDGRPFDPLNRPIPAIDRPIHERTVGGLGLWLVRNTMDELEYRREHGKNILVMRKRLPPSKPSSGSSGEPNWGEGMKGPQP